MRELLIGTLRIFMYARCIMTNKLTAVCVTPIMTTVACCGLQFEWLYERAYSVISEDIGSLFEVRFPVDTACDMRVDIMVGLC